MAGRQALATWSHKAKCSITRLFYGCCGMRGGPPAMLTSAEGCREHKAEGKEGAGSKGAGVLYWLRQDFRLHDNPALSAAAHAAKKQACA